MSLSSDPIVVDTAKAINRYLLARPNATETVDGVAKWWLLRQRYDDSKELVQKALDLLMDEGVVMRCVMPDGKVMYSKAESQQTQMNSNYSISSEEQ